MEYSIRLSDDGVYVLLEWAGNITIPEAMQALIESHARGRRLGIRCYLVDATAARNDERALSSFRFAQGDIPAMPEVDQLDCMAALVAPADHSHDSFEAAARGAGFDFTIFRDRQNALDHLHAAAQRLHRRDG